MGFFMQEYWSFLLISPKTLKNHSTIIDFSFLIQESKGLPSFTKVPSFFWSCHTAYKALAPWPGTEPRATAAIVLSLPHWMPGDPPTKVTVWVHVMPSLWKPVHLPATPTLQTLSQWAVRATPQSPQLGEDWSGRSSFQGRQFSWLFLIKQCSQTRTF